MSLEDHLKGSNKPIIEDTSEFLSGVLCSELRPTETGRSLYSTTPIKNGEKILDFEQRFINYSTTHTLRIDEDLHQESTDPEAFENFIDHSCDPNGAIEWKGVSYYALRDVLPGEKLTYHYATSDLGGEDPFECKCQSEKCLGYVDGFKGLTNEDKMRLQPFMSPYLKKGIAAELERKEQPQLQTDNCAGSKLQAPVAE